MIPVIVLLAVFVLIAVRRIGRYRFQIWQIMLLGALAVLITRQITPLNALRAVNADVMLFLFGVFVIGQALEDSGYLSYLSSRFFSRAKSLDILILFILLGAGGMSAFLMNDTIAIIGTPVVLLIARQNNGALKKPKILLLALAFAVTIGSVASPIGNPQNLLVAINGNIVNPFITFFKYLLVPTVINLFLAYLTIRLFFRKYFDHQPLVYPPEPIKDARLAALTKISLIILISLVLVKIILVFAGVKIDFRLTYIALAAAVPILLFSPKRLSVVRRIDWSTLVFFAAMFVLMESVWDSGFFQSILNGASTNLTSNGMIMAVSVVLSQFISNVPLVALYLPMIMHAGATTTGLMALAAGSTIAGNLTILGAASNVIIIQNAEKKGNETLSFLEFMKIGMPLTVINVLVYWFYFLLF
jgi:Na+/H+ antiporter NhaD/arsenite permease-like protein